MARADAQYAAARANNRAGACIGSDDGPLDITNRRGGALREASWAADKQSGGED